MAANPKLPPIASIRAQAHELIDQVPNGADWPKLLHEVQLVTDRALGIVAQERDPDSELRESLNRGLAELDAGQGIDDADLAREFGLNP